MADLSHPLAYAEEHPYVAGAVVFGGGLALLWLFGFFSRGSSGDTGQTNMAAAYYAAEAQQAVAGTQLNIATEQAQAATAQVALQTGAAVAIEQAHGETAQNIASSMYASNTTLGLAGTAADVTTAGYAADVAKTGIVYGAQTATVQANDAMNTAVANGNYAYLTAVANGQANEAIAYIHDVVPAELQITGGNFSGNVAGQFINAQQPVTAGWLREHGYSETQIARAMGGP